MTRHRIGARSNVTFFPLPWDLLMAQLQGLERDCQVGVGVPLPRSGADLSDVVRVLLKGGNMSDNDFVAQGRVRRHVIVALILDAKRIDHVSYKHVE